MIDKSTAELCSNILDAVKSCGVEYLNGVELTPSSDGLWEAVCYPYGEVHMVTEDMVEPLINGGGYSEIRIWNLPVQDVSFACRYMERVTNDSILVIRPVSWLSNIDVLIGHGVRGGTIEGSDLSELKEICSYLDKQGFRSISIVSVGRVKVTLINKDGSEKSGSVFEEDIVEMASAIAIEANEGKYVDSITVLGGEASGRYIVSTLGCNLVSIILY